MKTILVTGSSGFIGSNLCERLLKNNSYKIIGLDNMNDYYDIKLKKYRLNKLEKYSNFIFIEESISNKNKLNKIFKKYKPNIVVNLAAQAGVRYSIEHPECDIESNVIGFYNILEACRYNPVEHLIYASSSSVYGDNTKIPFNTDDNTDHPISLYAATKKSNEIFAYSYSKLFNITSTGLRFFTVYGPAGRPDMAYFSFTNKLVNNDIIEIYNNGNCIRDFTYIDDVIEGIMRVIENKPKSTYNLYNIGNNNPVKLLDFITILEEELVKVGVLSSNYDFESHKKLVSKQKGDLETTYADISNFEKDFNYRPNTSLRDGLSKFAKWYKDYYIDGGQL